MTDNAMKDIWRKTTAPAVINIDEQTFYKELNNKLVKFDKGIRARNLRENAAALIVIPIFTVMAIWVSPWLSKLGCILIVFWAAMTIYILLHTKRQRVKDDTLPLLEYLLQHRAYIAKEKRLLDTVLWWYILPFCVAVAMFGWGLGNWTLAVSSVVISIVIYAMNKQAIKKHIAPLLQKLDKEIESLEEE